MVCYTATFSSESEPCPEHFLEFYHPTDEMTEILASLPLLEFGPQSSPEEVESQLPSSFSKLQNDDNSKLNYRTLTSAFSQCVCCGCGSCCGGGSGGCGCGSSGGACREMEVHEW